MSYLVAFILLICHFTSQSQDQQTVLSLINEKVPTDSAFLINFVADVNMYHAVVRSQNSNNWELYRFEIYDDYTEDDERYWFIADDWKLLPKNYYFIALERDNDDYYNYLTLSNRRKQALLSMDFALEDLYLSDKKELKKWYQKVKKAHYDFDSINVIKKELNYSQKYVLASKNGKWGQIAMDGEFVIIDFLFNSPDEVPMKLASDDVDLHYYKELIQDARKSIKSDLVWPDTYHQDGIFYVSNKDGSSKGIYRHFGKNDIQTIVEARYDSIQFNINRPFFQVYQNGKLGIYLNYFYLDVDGKESIACQFDNAHLLQKDGDYYLALQQNGKWNWYDWLSGEKKTSQNASRLEDLNRPDYVQKQFLD